MTSSPNASAIAPCVSAASGLSAVPLTCTQPAFAECDALGVAGRAAQWVRAGAPDQLERVAAVAVVERQRQRGVAGEQRVEQRRAGEGGADDAAEGRPALRDRRERRARAVDGFADPDQRGDAEAGEGRDDERARRALHADQGRVWRFADAGQHRRAVVEQRWVDGSSPPGLPTVARVRQ